MENNSRKLSANEKTKYVLIVQPLSHPPAEAPIAAPKIKCCLNTRCCIECLLGLVELFSKDKKKCIQEFEFGSFIYGKISGIDRKLMTWLLDHFSPSTITIELHGRSYTITFKDVERLIGLSDGGCPVDINGSMKAIEELKKNISIAHRGIRWNYLIRMQKGRILRWN